MSSQDKTLFALSLAPGIQSVRGELAKALEVPVPLLFIIELPFGNISECLRGALFPPVSIRFADVSELLSLTGNALEFLLAKNNHKYLVSKQF